MEPIHEETIFFCAMIAFVGFGIWLLFRRRQLRTHLEYHKLEVLNKMVDKYGSSAEFIAFLQTEQGKNLLASNGESNGGKSSGKTTVLRYIQAGVMLFLLGGGFMITQDIYAGGTDPNEIRKVQDMAYWGTMCMMLGVGLLLVSIITHFWNKAQAKDRSGVQ